MTSISLGAIPGLFGTISTLILVLSLIGIINSAIAGDMETVDKQTDELAKDIEDDVKNAPLEPIKPYVEYILSY